MLIHIPPTQVADYWDVIKKACLEADQVAAEHTVVYCNNLLQDLLSGKRHCLFYMIDSAIQVVLVYYIKSDALTGVVTMTVANLYSFVHKTDEEWQDVVERLKLIAKSWKCTKICGETIHPRIEEFFKKYYNAVERKLLTFDI